jgi:hypothetical protein
MTAAYLLVFVGHYLVTGTYLTDARVVLAADRELDLFSDSAFPNHVVNENLLDDVLNAFYALLRLLLPFPLLAVGKLQYVAFVVWEILNVALFAALFARVWRRADTDACTEFAAAWMLAFTLTQAIFESDYGTFLRHQTTLLPALALLCINAIWLPRRQAPMYSRS